MTKRPFPPGRRDRLGRLIKRARNAPGKDEATVHELNADAVAGRSWQDDVAVVDQINEARRIFNAAERFVGKHSHDEFVADEDLQRSGSYLIVELREVFNRLPSEFRDQTDAVPWHKIRGMGNILAHQYFFAIDIELVWSTLENRLPEVGAQLEEALGHEDTSPS